MTTVSTEAARPLFADGLKNIHAIQKDAKAMMEKVIGRLDHYPEARARLQAHLGDKDREMQRAEQILKSMGEEPSALRDAGASAMGAMSAAMTSWAGDDVLKDALITYGLASMEIAAYEALLQLGEAAGEPQSAPILQQSLQEEKAIASWLHEHLAGTVNRHIQLRATGQEAAH